MTTAYSTMDSPVGQLTLVARDDALCAVRFEGEEGLDSAAARRDDVALAPFRQQLTEYFEGRREHFDLPLAPSGTDFQLAVWAALGMIPYGHTVSYRDIAERLGKPTATRAVGAANGRNPLPIVVPCHRVIGRDGALVGYGGGLERKRKLLAIEGLTLTR